MSAPGAQGPCLRCGKKFHPDGRHFTNCDNKRQNPNQIAAAWPNVANTGTPKDNIGSFADCDALLAEFEKTPDLKKFKGQDITKWMLENAFVTVYDKKGNKKQPPSQPSKQPAKNSAPTAGPSKGSSAGPSSAGLAYRGKSSTSNAAGNRNGGTSVEIQKVVQTHARLEDPPRHLEKQPMKEYKPQELGNSTTAKRIVTNYLQVKTVPKHVYMYSLKYGKIATGGQAQPSGTAASTLTFDDLERAQRLLILEGLRNAHPLRGRNDWADTDGRLIWSIKPLWDQDREPLDGETNVTGIITFHKLSGKPCTVNGVQFTFVRKLDMHVPGSNSPDNRVLVDTPQEENKSASVHKTALNALISKYADDRNPAIMTMGPNKFFMKAKVKNFRMLEAHRGYFTSVRPGKTHVLLNIGTSTGAFYEDVYVSEFLDEFCKPDWKEYGSNADTRAQKLLIGRKVLIMYTREQHDPSFDPNHEDNRQRVISEFGKPPSQQTFDYNGTSMTVANYFTSVLGLGRPSDDYSCVNVGAKAGPNSKGKQVWIPAEWLLIKSGQIFNRRLASKHMEAMIGVALRGPGANQWLLVDQGLKAFLPQGAQATASMQNDIQIDVNRDLLSIPATFLKSPVIGYANNRTEGAAGATWNVRSQQFYSVVHKAAARGIRRTVAVLDFRTTTDYQGVLTGGNMTKLNSWMMRRMRFHGMSVDAPRDADYWSYTGVGGRQGLAQETDGAIEKNVTKALSAMSPGGKAPELYLIVLDDKNADAYGKIKRLFDQRKGLHTVCITAAKLQMIDKGTKEAFNANEQQMGLTLSNLALKFNLKLRGQNHAVLNEANQSAFALIADDTMVVGADVSHAPSSMAYCPSVAAIVASDSSTFAHFPGSMRLQASKQEFIAELHDMMVERLLHYAEKMGRLPARILFYRDGVGEDMYDHVRENEIAMIHDAFEDAKSQAAEYKIPGYSRPKQDTVQLAFVIVGKRHNTRFFVKDPVDAVSNYNANVKPGLIVDDIITQPVDPKKGTFDFFLQSHQAIIGTARPAHYVVLEKGGLSEAQIKDLTFKFCYNFARATKGVSYVAPAYYADRLCERGAVFLKGYTANREYPHIDMTGEQENGGVEGRKDYERAVADAISWDPAWNPHFNDRANPWHSKFDDVMFWL